ncbi:MAG: acetate/propionate family kinase [Pseudomonadota bacterium]
MPLLLTLNAGSSSIKFSLTALPEGGPGTLPQSALPAPLAHGQVSGIGGTAARLSIESSTHGKQQHTLPSAEAAPSGHEQALAAVLHWLEHNLPEQKVALVSHRVVHGGVHHAQPVRIDAPVLAQLEALAPLAPLHQPHNLAGIRAAMAAFGQALQVACFDTAFHRQHPFVADTFALPRPYYDAGVRRYGFHGLSYEYIARALEQQWPALHQGRVIVAHLGNGASMCALRHGRSIDSSMGFTALDGLPMGTRCGQIDPGVLLYLLTEKGHSPAQLTELLYQQSGLKGMSGLSNDVRELLQSAQPEAAQALDYFVARCKREIGALSASLGGLDALVFTGGIGENAVAVRARMLADMGWLGIDIDAQANAHACAGSGGPISGAGARVTVLVLPTDEERMLAEHALALWQAD